MTEKRFYSEHWHCYQHNIVDRNLQDDDGVDWIIGTANGEDDAKNIVDLLNEQDERIKELEKEKEFWKHNCISESNRNSILICELGFAQEQGYEWSDAFEKYENYVKENSEWNNRYLSEKNGDVE